MIKIKATLKVISLSGTLSIIPILTIVSCQKNKPVDGLKDNDNNVQKDKGNDKVSKKIITGKDEQESVLSKDQIYFNKYRSDIQEFNNSSLFTSAQQYPLTLNYGHKGYNLYGLEFAKDSKRHKDARVNKDLRRAFVKKDIKHVYYLELSKEKFGKPLIVAWITLENNKLILAQRFLKNLKPTLKFRRDDYFEYELGRNKEKYKDLLFFIKEMLNK